MTATGAHPPTHLLAELAEGVLDDAQAREVQAHVDQCLTCRATLDDLAQVTVALRGLPAELPVPEFVAARISHALAAERASGADGAVPVADAEGGTVAWFRRRLPQGIAAAASVAVLGLAGYVAVDGGGGDDSSAGDAAAAGAQEAGASDTGTGFGSSSDGSRIGPPSAPMYDADPSDTPTANAEQATPIDPTRLTAAVEDVVQGSAKPAGTDTCGDPLAEELGLPVLGTTMVGAGVLVVLEDATTYDGWLINTCGSTSNESMGPQVEVPKSE
ncbi:zf-HC2 domain-containing protein [Jiangella endophytica]|uniref:zf-HC2 domain-containing protein n=1 Tax=Jiangella endophytica TaxID=1623398 RepID=UPI000E34C9D0|nr:zf-HC2 domain-containing protein [Jiangella endophytica]